MILGENSNMNNVYLFLFAVQQCLIHCLTTGRCKEHSQATAVRVLVEWVYWLKGKGGNDRYSGDNKDYR